MFTNLDMSSVRCQTFLWNIHNITPTFVGIYIINRLGIAGAVLQTPSSLIKWLTHSLIVCGNIFKKPVHPKPEELDSWNLRECSSHTMCHVSHVRCHVSRVTCQVSLVICNFLFYFINFFIKKKYISFRKINKVVELVSGG